MEFLTSSFVLFILEINQCLHDLRCVYFVKVVVMNLSVFEKSLSLNLHIDSFFPSYLIFPLRIITLISIYLKADYLICGCYL